VAAIGAGLHGWNCTALLYPNFFSWKCILKRSSDGKKQVRYSIHGAVGRTLGTSHFGCYEQGKRWSRAPVAFMQELADSLMSRFFRVFYKATPVLAGH